MTGGRPGRMLLAALLLAGCVPPAGNDRPAFPPAEPLVHIVWPSDRPRVRYLGALAGSADLPRRRSWLRVLGGLLAGEGGYRLARPVGVAARAGIVAIADPGVPALFLLDTRDQSLRAVRDPGGTPLESPVGVAVGADGSRVFLADSVLGEVLVLGARGELLARWGKGSLTRPVSVALDEPRRRLYVADAQGQRVAILDLDDGTVVGTRGDWGRSPGEFRWPSFVTVDAGGNVYVVDSLNFRIVVFDAAGQPVSQFGQAGDGSGDFARPKGIALTSAGHLCVVDALFDVVQVFSLPGQLLLTVGQRGTGPGEFWLPTGAAVDEHDRLYVADSYNRRVQVFEFLPEPAGSAAIVAAEE